MELSGHGAEALVLGWSKGLGEILSQLEQDLAEFLASAPGGAGGVP
jgi:hypothetical protein